MIEDRVREDIAFIRHAVEDGRNFAAASSPDMMVWGIAVAIGYLGTYAFVRGWSPIRPSWVWALCIGLPWLYSLRRLLPLSIEVAPTVRWLVPSRCCGLAAASF
jgi:hypothetical protein